MWARLVLSNYFPLFEITYGTAISNFWPKYECDLLYFVWLVALERVVVVKVVFSVWVIARDKVVSILNAFLTVLIHCKLHHMIIFFNVVQTGFDWNAFFLLYQLLTS